jgi:hypothetical protein
MTIFSELMACVGDICRCRSEEDPTKEVIVGCMVFREFQDREFAELVFATVSAKHQTNVR